ncbi:hypothetical protein D3C87_1948470 [compost metagenome]
MALGTVDLEGRGAGCNRELVKLRIGDDLIERACGDLFQIAGLGRLGIGKLDAEFRAAGIAEHALGRIG